MICEISVDKAALGRGVAPNVALAMKVAYVLIIVLLLVAVFTHSSSPAILQNTVRSTIVQRGLSLPLLGGTQRHRQDESEFFHRQLEPAESRTKRVLVAKRPTLAELLSTRATDKQLRKDKEQEETKRQIREDPKLLVEEQSDSKEQQRQNENKGEDKATKSTGGQRHLLKQLHHFQSQLKTEKEPSKIKLKSKSDKLEKLKINSKVEFNTNVDLLRKKEKAVPKDGGNATHEKDQSKLTVAEKVGTDENNKNSTILVISNRNSNNSTLPISAHAKSNRSVISKENPKLRKQFRKRLKRKRLVQNNRKKKRNQLNLRNRGTAGNNTSDTNDVSSSKTSKLGHHKKERNISSIAKIERTRTNHNPLEGFVSPIKIVEIPVRNNTKTNRLVSSRTKLNKESPEETESRTDSNTEVKTKSTNKKSIATTPSVRIITAGRKVLIASAKRNETKRNVRKHPVFVDRLTRKRGTENSSKRRHGLNTNKLSNVENKEKLFSPLIELIGTNFTNAIKEQKDIPKTLNTKEKLHLLPTNETYRNVSITQQGKARGEKIRRSVREVTESPAVTPGPPNAAPAASVPKVTVTVTKITPKPRLEKGEGVLVGKGVTRRRGSSNCKEESYSRDRRKGYYEGRNPGRPGRASPHRPANFQRRGASTRKQPNKPDFTGFHEVKITENEGGGRSFFDEIEHTDYIHVFDRDVLHTDKEDVSKYEGKEKKKLREYDQYEKRENHNKGHNFLDEENEKAGKEKKQYFTNYKKEKKAATKSGNKPKKRLLGGHKKDPSFANKFPTPSEPRHTKLSPNTPLESYSKRIRIEKTVTDTHKEPKSANTDLSDVQNAPAILNTKKAGPASNSSQLSQENDSGGKSNEKNKNLSSSEAQENLQKKLEPPPGRESKNKRVQNIPTKLSPSRVVNHFKKDDIKKPTAKGDAERQQVIKHSEEVDIKLLENNQSQPVDNLPLKPKKGENAKELVAEHQHEDSGRVVKESATEKEVLPSPESADVNSVFGKRLVPKPSKKQVKKVKEDKSKTSKEKPLSEDIKKSKIDEGNTKKVEATADSSKKDSDTFKDGDKGPNNKIEGAKGNNLIEEENINKEQLDSLTNKEVKQQKKVYDKKNVENLEERRENKKISSYKPEEKPKTKASYGSPLGNINWNEIFSDGFNSSPKALKMFKKRKNWKYIAEVHTPKPQLTELSPYKQKQISKHLKKKTPQKLKKHPSKNGQETKFEGASKWRGMASPTSRKKERKRTPFPFYAMEGSFEEYKPSAIDFTIF